MDLSLIHIFLHWLDKFSDANTVKFTVTLTADASVATEDRKSTRLNSSHVKRSRMPSSA